ncbi:DUF4158 domain-containing protein [Streptomyces sp. NPDC060028]|uniref:DUF4158 domain-containing protein n=1 Tax=Streptomyces sp. NPDC060028 TaxID=3347041 RepID=UPI0036D0D019
MAGLRPRRCGRRSARGGRPPGSPARARQLGLAVADLAGYGEREQPRTDHLREIAEYLGWKPAKTIELKELDEFLLARAMEHDAPSLLFRLGCEYLRSAKVIRPGVVSLLGEGRHRPRGRRAGDPRPRGSPVGPGAGAGSGRAAGLRCEAAVLAAALAGDRPGAGVADERGRRGRD